MLTMFTSPAKKTFAPAVKNQTFLLTKNVHQR